MTAAGTLGKWVLEMTDFTKPMPMDSSGKNDVYFTPKVGVMVKAMSAWQPKAGSNSIQLSDYLGTAIVFGEELPRADSIVLTEESDPGPGEKGHVAVQKVADYKSELIAPAGFYSVWIVPSNGVKAQRIAERIRIRAGRETRVGE